MTLQIQIPYVRTDRPTDAIELRVNGRVVFQGHIPAGALTVPNGSITQCARFLACAAGLGNGDDRN